MTFSVLWRTLYNLVKIIVAWNGCVKLSVRIVDRRHNYKNTVAPVGNMRKSYLVSSQLQRNELLNSEYIYLIESFRPS